MSKSPLENGLEWKEVEKPDGYSGEWARKLQSVSPPDYVIVRVPYVTSATGELKPRYVIWRKGALLTVRFSPEDAKAICVEDFAKNKYTRYS